MEFSKTNEFSLLLGKNLTNQKSLTSLGSKLVIAGALVQYMHGMLHEAITSYCIQMSMIMCIK